MSNKANTQRRRLMKTGSIPRVILTMSVPTVIASLIDSIYSLTDTFFISYLGTNATAAVSVNAALDRIIVLSGSMVAVGAGSYISRLIGAEEDKKADRVLSTVFCVAFIFGTVIMFFGILFTQPLVRMLGAVKSCEQYSIQYARYVLFAAPLMASNLVLNQCLRAEGSATRSMVGIGIGGIINMILDPVFIIELDLGVAGASMATAISKLVSFCVLIYPYIAKKSILHLSVRSFGLSVRDFTEIISIGSSSLFRSVMNIVSSIVLNNIAASISVSMLAAVGAAIRIMRFPFSILLGFGNGFQPVAGFNWGAGNYKRLWKSFQFSAFTAVVASTMMGIGIALSAVHLIGIFVQEDPFMLRYGALCIRMECLALPAQGWVVVVNMLCAATGNAKGAFFLSIGRQGLFFIPIIYPLAYFFGAEGIASAQAVADLLTLFLAVPLLMRMKNLCGQLKNDTKIQQFKRNKEGRKIWRKNQTFCL